MRFARHVWVIIAVLIVVSAAAAAVRLSLGAYRAVPVRPANAAGDSACISCHDQKSGFEQTAHHLSLRLPARANILGSFRTGENVLRTSNPRLHFHMDSTATGFYETAVVGRPPDTTARSERIAYVAGSRKGQSFLYWRGDRLYQLPVSYWTAFGWGNSPSYPDGVLDFDRQIPPRCLECHTTWFDSIRDSLLGNRYRSDSAMLGISCETCHTAGSTHVTRERSVLHAVLPVAIVNPARLSRQRQLDACALCHGGIAPLRSAPFSYVPGQPLQKLFLLSAAPDTNQVDVHGNQVALLARSRCFQRSQMTCATCHDVHRVQRDLGELSSRCLTCHSLQSCGLFPKYGAALRGRCVDCHMPVQQSNTIIANERSGQFHVKVRTHWIKVYPELNTP
jgi:cytochrome c554/c'-like protein